MDKTSQPAVLGSSEIISRSPELGRLSVDVEAEQTAGDLTSATRRDTSEQSVTSQQHHALVRLKDTEAEATDGLSISALSDVQTSLKPKEKIDLWMKWARAESNLEYATYYQAKAAAVAKEYNLPIPKLSDDEVLELAKTKRDLMMDTARSSFSIKRAIDLEKAAQEVARTWGIPITELSLADLEKLRDWESAMHEPMDKHRLQVLRGPCHD